MGVGLLLGCFFRLLKLMLCRLMCGGVLVFRWLVVMGSLCSFCVSVLVGGLFVWLLVYCVGLMWILLVRKVLVVRIIVGVWKFRFIWVIMLVIWLFLMIRLFIVCWNRFRFGWVFMIWWIVVL